MNFDDVDVTDENEGRFTFLFPCLYLFFADFRYLERASAASSTALRIIRDWL